MTLEPMNEYCLECQRAKKMRKQARSAKARGADIGPKPTKFGEQVTADTLIAVDEEDRGLNEESCAIAMLDGGSEYGDCLQFHDRSAESVPWPSSSSQGPTTTSPSSTLKAAKDAKRQVNS